MDTKEILQYVLEYGGITYDCLSNNRIGHTFGYYVSLNNLSKGIFLRELCIREIETYIFLNNTYLQLPNKFFGIWIDETSGIVYLDISIHIPGLEQALNFARSNKQLAIWDCANKIEIKTEV